MIPALALLLLLAQEPVFRLPSGSAGSEPGAPANLDFESGEPGKAPPEWAFTQESRLAGYLAELRREGCHGGSGCALLLAGPNKRRGGEGQLIQPVAAEPYLGKRMRLRAWIRIEGGRAGDAAKVVFTTDGEKAEATFIQKGRGATSPEWTLAEVEGKVPMRAELIYLVISFHGQGRAWIDDVTFEPVGQ